MCPDNIFGERLHELMQNSTPKVTQQRLADAVGVKRQSIAQYLAGNVQPPLSTVVAIANYFGVTIDYLTGRTNISSQDLEAKEICAKTGLSEKALAALMQEPHTQSLINRLLESRFRASLFRDITNYRTLTVCSELYSLKPEEHSFIEKYNLVFISNIGRAVQKIFMYNKGQELTQNDLDTAKKMKTQLSLNVVVSQVLSLAENIQKSEAEQEAGKDAEKEAGGE